MTSAEFSELAAWMAEKSASMKYGTCQVMITVHGGQIRYIDKTATEREKL
jgi:hypothetical protein